MRDSEVFGVRNTQEHDRQIAGNALSPQPLLRAGTAPNRFGRRAHRRSCVKQMTGEALEKTRLPRLDAKIVELHLRLGPGQRGRAVVCGDVAVLVYKVKYRRP